MATPELAPGTRRAVPVEPSGELAGDRTAPVWACERFDGLLWQLVGMAGSERECREFLHGS
ncbi:MAG: hypothetical protein JWP11_806 [Frankiales bacterium]|nr:hypothetical protein [Frankiales bacterium]